jgi:hypothetical protein
LKDGSTFMWRWGWRWLFCWLSVLVTACAQLTSPTPVPKTPNRTPSLQGFTPHATAPPTQPVRPAYTATPLGGTATRLVSEDLLAMTRLGLPTCYESSVQTLICLGWVQNIGDEPLINVSIQVYLLTPQGQPLAIVETAPALSLLSPGKGSPYRAIFAQASIEDWAVYAEVSALQSAAVLTALPALDLPLVNLETTWNGTQYQIKGQVLNNQPVRLRSIRVVVTFRDEQGRVTGYRVQDLSPGAEGSTAFSIKGAPLTHRPGFVSVAAQGDLDR